MRQYKFDTKIIAAWGCLGKTTFAKKYPSIALDLESVQYNYKYDFRELTDEIAKFNPCLGQFIHELYPYNYVGAILSNLGRYRYIFITLAREILRELDNLGLPYTIVYPSVTRKEKILKDAEKRGNTKVFLNVINEILSSNEEYASLTQHFNYQNFDIIRDDEYIEDYLKRKHNFMCSDVFFIHGAPGAGKDTLSQKYIQEHPLCGHISMGDIYRQIGTNTFVSQFRDVLFEDVKNNRLSKAETTGGVLFEAVAHKLFDTYLISGFPHHVSEIDFFKTHSVEYNINTSNIVFLRVSRNQAIQRMINRGLRVLENLKMYQNETVSDYYARRYQEYVAQQPTLLNTLQKLTDIKYINADNEFSIVYDDFCKVVDLSNKLQKLR